ncbi:MAG: phage tail protein [Sphingobacteriales bacterium]|nr:phage tail protein [Sphingobacteriales bacterium]
MATYPMPAYHFSVEWGGTRIGFTEVTGLSMETEVIEYREGSSPDFHKTKMPGLQKFSNVTLKRGLVAGDTDFYKWMLTTQMNKVERRDVVIHLLDEKHQPVMTWKLHNAWPVKLEGPALKAGSNEVAIETLELTHEGLSIVN